MGKIKKVFKSKTRITVLLVDTVCVALLFSVYMLLCPELVYPMDVFAIIGQILLCVLAMVFIGAYDTIDVGLFTICKCTVALFVSAVATLTVIIIATDVDKSVVGGYFIPVMIALICMCVTRALCIYFTQEYRQVISKSVKKSALIVGAGAASHILLRELDGNSSPYYGECIVDDDPYKLGMKIHGVPVVGTVDMIPQVVEEHNIDTIIIAMPSVTGERMTQILTLCTNTKRFVKTLPSISEMLEHDVALVNSIKSIKMEDLLGRNPITIDTQKVQEMVRDKVCMVTGGGGSIGSELSRQIMSYRPKKLIIVDIYENNAYEIQQELRIKYGNDIPLKVEIASVRDLDKMDKLFDHYRPELVFHAAAHKHVPLMEYSPEETVKNNVFGTYNVASLAIKYKTSRFLLISTDKAVNPTNVMGASKRCCEEVIKFFSDKGTDTVFVTVRFGNVLGSNGSVVPLFERQIESGGPVTITHPEIRRYFMTIPEAVSLVLQAETMAMSGQIFVLDMGKPIKIVTMAENLIRMYGYEPYTDINIKFTGLREGEKLYEELRLDEEEIVPTYNSKIFIGSHIDLPDNFEDMLFKLKELADNNDGEAVVEQYRLLVPTFTPDTRVHSVC